MENYDPIVLLLDSFFSVQGWSCAVFSFKKLDKVIHIFESYLPADFVNLKRGVL